MIAAKLVKVRRMKNIANIITFTRILSAFLMVLVVPMAGVFWILYIYCFISDILDGYIARKKNIVSAEGAILDSAADTIFFCVVLFSVVRTLVLPQWLLWGTGFIALIRVAGYMIGFIKYQSFTSLHTWLNKLTGFLLCLSPLLLVVIDLNILGIMIGGIALVSAIEELIITIRSKELKRDIKGILDK